MEALKNWVLHFRNRWGKYQANPIEEEYEILEFDHTPYIDEIFKKNMGS